MKQPFRSVRWLWGVFYLKDKSKGAQTSLKTDNQVEAQRLLQARNEAEVMPALNLQFVRAYLAPARNLDFPQRRITAPSWLNKACASTAPAARSM